jgi:hypothetical protein
MNEPTARVPIVVWMGKILNVTELAITSSRFAPNEKTTKCGWTSCYNPT